VKDNKLLEEVIDRMRPLFTELEEMARENRHYEAVAVNEQIEFVKAVMQMRELQKRRQNKEAMSIALLADLGMYEKQVDDFIRGEKLISNTGDLKSGENLPDALKLADTEIPIEKVEFRDYPDTDRTLIYVEWYKQGLKDGFKKAIKYLQNEYLAACGGGK